MESNQDEVLLLDDVIKEIIKHIDNKFKLIQVSLKKERDATTSNMKKTLRERDVAISYNINEAKKLAEMAINNRDCTRFNANLSQQLTTIGKDVIKIRNDHDIQMNHLLRHLKPIDLEKSNLKEG